MSSDDISISVSHVSKRYPVYKTPRDRLKQFIVSPLRSFARRPPCHYYEEFDALEDISFEVGRGETIGIVGRNGSGKSTLLQIICGTLTPTGGSVYTRGRVAALLELGSGFNPEFTGRENVYMNASVLGLGREEVEARFDDIAAFADIGAFIDQPVMTYSSGMILRLAFAVQSQIDPDILIVDEALAVGDAKFQAKCFERLRRLKEQGTSIIMVTHSSEQIVSHCTRALLLERGQQLELGEPRRIVNRYLDILFGKDRLTEPAPTESEAPSVDEADPMVQIGDDGLSVQEDCFAERTGYNPHEYRWGDGAAKILDYHLATGSGAFPTAITSGEEVRLSVSVGFYQDLVRPVLGVTIKTKEGVTVYGVNSETLDCDAFMDFGQRDTRLRIDVVFCARLAPGDYFVSLGIASKTGAVEVPHDRRYDAIHLQVRADRNFYGLADLDLAMHAREVGA